MIFIFFFTDLQCLQAVVQSKTKTLSAKCHDMLLQRMEMFKNAKALVRKFTLCIRVINFHFNLLIVFH